MPIILNSVIAGRYYITEYLGSAAFSRVVQAHDLQTGIDVCLKIIKNDKDFFDQSLDEIKLLKFVNKYDPADQCHILRLYDYFYHQVGVFDAKYPVISRVIFYYMFSEVRRYCRSFLISICYIICPFCFFLADVKSALYCLTANSFMSVIMLFLDIIQP